jgi:hypothetical protein
MKYRLALLFALSLNACGVAVSPSGDAASDASADGTDGGRVSCQSGPCGPGMVCDGTEGRWCTALPAGCVVEPLPNCVDRECTIAVPCPPCMSSLCPANTECLRERRPDAEGNRYLNFGCRERDQ